MIPDITVGSTMDTNKDRCSSSQPYTTIMTKLTHDYNSPSTNISNDNDSSNHDPHNMTRQEIQEYLEHLQNEEFQTYIPALVFILLVAVVGVFGNILVLAVYKSKFHRSPTRIFIMTIAMFDTVTNVVCIPGDVYEIFTLWTYSTPVWCHLHRYIMLWTTMSSAVILLPLCVSRYLKICRPFNKQVTTRHAKIASPIMVLMASIASIPYGIIQGVHTRPTPRSGIVGQQCGVGEAYVDTIWPVVNNSFLLLLYLCTCVPLIALYTLIGIKAFKHRNPYGRPVAKIELSTSATYSRSAVDTTGHNQDKSNKGFLAKLVPTKKEKRYRINTSYEIVGSNQSQVLNSELYAEECKPVKDEANSLEGKTGTSPYKRENATRSLEMARIMDGAKTFVNSPMTPGLATKSNSISNKKNQSKATDSYPDWPAESDGDDEMMADSNTWTSDSNIGEGNESKLPDNKVIIDHRYDADVINSLEMQVVRFEYAVSRETSLTKLNEKRQNDKGDDRENDEEDHEDKTNDITGREENEHDETNKSRRDFQRNVTEVNVTRKHQNPEHTDGVNKPPAKKSNQRAISKTTTMLFLITFVYIFSFVPHLALLFFRFTQPESFQAMGKVAQAVYHFFLRTYFVNSATNAIIYSFCDNRFRREALNLFRWKK